MKYAGKKNSESLFLELEIAGTPELLKVVRASISEFGMLLGLASHEIYDINLSVNEVCANIMEHDYKWDASQRIRISLTGQPKGIEVKIRDFAPPKDPTLFRSRDLEEMKGSGLGLFLVGELMDEVHYNSEVEEGNEIIMRKSCNIKVENDYGV